MASVIEAINVSQCHVGWMLIEVCLYSVYTLKRVAIDLNINLWILGFSTFTNEACCIVYFHCFHHPQACKPLFNLTFK